MKTKNIAKKDQAPERVISKIKKIVKSFDKDFDDGVECLQEIADVLGIDVVIDESNDED